MSALPDEQHCIILYKLQEPYLDFTDSHFNHESVLKICKIRMDFINWHKITKFNVKRDQDFTDVL